MPNGDTSDSRKAVIGTAKDFWLYDSSTGFDLTRPPTSTSAPVSPRVTIQTTRTPITVDPAKSALVIIDMQNFFLSPAFGRSRGAGHNATDQLVQHAIPAARKAGIRIIWLNWGLSREDIDIMPPTVFRTFGFEADASAAATKTAVNRHGAPINPTPDSIRDAATPGCKFRSLGSPCGLLPDPVTGGTVDAGDLLMRDQWNSALYGPLGALWEEGRKLGSRADVWIHKDRMSGMWGSGTACERFLQAEGLRTLFFTGVNTDQCVGGTYQDCFNKGYDCVLLNDGCGTTSPGFASQCMEFNAAETWGFMTSCRALAEGVDGMEK